MLVDPLVWAHAAIRQTDTIARTPDERLGQEDAVGFVMDLHDNRDPALPFELDQVSLDETVALEEMVCIRDFELCAAVSLVAGDLQKTALKAATRAPC